MEATQDISDDKYSSEEQTTSSVNKDQVQREVISEQKSPAHANKLEQLPREIEFLNRHRNKIRLCDPKGVYEFRHIQQTWFQSLVQLVTMLMSLTCLVGLYYLVFQESKDIVVGVGEVSNLTWIDVLEVVIIAGIVFMGIKGLSKQAKQHPQKRYRIAMLANSFNRMWFNFFRLQLVILILLIAANVIKYPEVAFINFDYFEEGAIADLASAISTLIVILICFRAFRFCGKELTA